MAADWMGNSEIVTGLVICGKLDPRRLNLDHVASPYDEIVRLYQDKPDITLSDVIEKVGFGTVNTAQTAIESLNGASTKVNWVKLLDSSYVTYDCTNRLEKLLKKLRRGEDVTGDQLHEVADRLATGDTGMISLADIEPREVPVMKTGYAPIDVHLGGIPETGLVVIGGNPGVGKTSFAIGIGASIVHTYKDKRVAFFTLEMLNAEFAMRAKEVSNLTPEEKARILVCDEVLSVSEIASRAASIKNLGIVIIDFADLMISGKVDESEMGIIYKTCAALAKRLHVPVILLSQLSRTYQGGIPRPWALRYTGLAEALAWAIFMLYSPSLDYFSDQDGENRGKKASKDNLPVVAGRAYIVCWKFRGGFRIHGGPGAIQVNWCGDTGWSKLKGRWFTLEKGSRPSNDDDDEEFS